MTAVTAPDSGGTLGERIRRHAEGVSSPLYAELMAGMAQDWEDGGPVAEVLHGWQDAPAGSFVQLRLLAGLHRLVLQRQAPHLATFHPSVGGDGAPAGAWAVAREIVAAHVEDLRDGLDLAPQTNEVGRAAALALGLVDAAWRSGRTRVRLLEVGASGGLNLLVDRFGIGGAGWSWGPADSPVQLGGALRAEPGAVQGCAVQVVSRRGCDLSPVDVTSQEGRLLLTSFVWPDQLDRFERLRSALQVAQDHPVEVDRAPAGEWLEGQLAAPPGDDVLTVVWQSITRLYWPAAEIDRVEAALAEAGTRLPLAHVAMEYLGAGAGPGPGPGGGAGAGVGPGAPQPGSASPVLDVRVWTGGHLDGRRHELAAVGDHGVPVTLLDDVRVGPASTATTPASTPASTLASTPAHDLPII
jgi:hypothetical protein